MNEKKECVRIFLKNGFRYEGTLLKEDEKFLTIHDTRSGKNIDISLDSISVRERL